MIWLLYGVLTFTGTTCRPMRPELVLYSTLLVASLREQPSGGVWTWEGFELRSELFALFWPQSDECNNRWCLFGQLSTPHILATRHFFTKFPRLRNELDTFFSSTRPCRGGRVNSRNLWQRSRWWLPEQRTHLGIFLSSSPRGRLSPRVGNVMPRSRKSVLPLPGDWKPLADSGRELTICPK